jgi:hypothetical protein
MQKARGQASEARRLRIALPQLVGVWFQVLLTPLIGVLFIVRSRYFSLLVAEEYLALEGGPPSFTQSSTSSVLLWNAGNNAGLSLWHTGLSPSTVPLSSGFCWRCLCNCLPAPATPPVLSCESKNRGFGLFRFRSPLLTESRLISFPAGTKMFQFPAFAPYGLCIQP